MAEQRKKGGRGGMGESFRNCVVAVFKVVLLPLLPLRRIQ